MCAVAAGDRHSLSACVDGGCFYWGTWSPKRAAILLPERIPALCGECVSSVAASYCVSCAVTLRGELWQWGHWGQVQLNEPTPLKGTLLDSQRVVSVSMSLPYCLALTADGAVFSWSPTKIVPYIDYSDAYPDYDPRDALGHGNGRGRLRARIDEEMKPRQIEALAGQRICSIGTGSGQSLAITGGDAPSQLAWSWGALFEVHPNLPRDTLDDLRSATSGSFEELEESDMVRMKRYAVSRFGHGDDPHREYYLPHRVSLSSRKHVHMIP